MSEPTPAPALPYPSPPQPECAHCYDTGYMPCDDCGGDGVDVECDEDDEDDEDDDEWECMSCDGEGEEPCTVCCEGDDDLAEAMSKRALARTNQWANDWAERKRREQTPCPASTPNP